MIIKDIQPLTPLEFESMSLARRIDSFDLHDIRRRDFLKGLTATAGGVLIPTSFATTHYAHADILSLITAFIQGGINFVNQLIKWGETIRAVFTLINDAEDAVKGLINSRIVKPLEGIRDTASKPTELAPGSKMLIEDDSFVANKDYGEGNFSYEVETAANQVSGGFKVIKTESL